MNEWMKRNKEIWEKPVVWVWSYYRHQRVPNDALHFLALRSYLEELGNGTDQSKTLMKSLFLNDCCLSSLAVVALDTLVAHEYLSSVDCCWSMATDKEGREGWRRLTDSIRENIDDLTCALVDCFDVRTSRMKPVKRGDDELVIVYLWFSCKLPGSTFLSLSLSCIYCFPIRRMSKLDAARDTHTCERK